MIKTVMELLIEFLITTIIIQVIRITIIMKDESNKKNFKKVRVT